MPKPIRTVIAAMGIARAPTPPPSHQDHAPAAPTRPGAMTPSGPAMMATMHLANTGNAARDFVATMIPHRPGAIDMAPAV
jgi:uncharacterized protein (DUF305 family)